MRLPSDWQVRRSSGACFTSTPGRLSFPRKPPRLDGEFASIHTSIGGLIEVKAGVHTRNRQPFLEWRFAKGGHAVLQVGNRSRVIARDPMNPFAAATAVHLGNFVDAIQSGGIPRGDARDNRKTLAMVTAAYDSARLGRAVDMSEYQNMRVVQ